MTIPKSIVTKDQWEAYKKDNHYVNDGTTGWFPDAYGILHFIYNLHNPTNEDKRLVQWNKNDRPGYFESQYTVLPPPHLLENPDEKFRQGAFNQWN